MHGGDDGAAAERGHVERAFRREEAGLRQAQRAALGADLGLFERGETPDDDEVLPIGLRRARHHRRQDVIFALGVRRVEPVHTGRVHAHARRALDRLGAALQVHLEDLWRAGRAEEDRPRVVLIDDRLGDREDRREYVAPGQVVLVEHRRREPRLCEDHDAERRLQKALARPGADHEEEAVLHLVMQPPDRSERAEVVTREDLRARVQHGSSRYQTAAATATSPACT